MQNNVLQTFGRRQSTSPANLTWRICEGTMSKLEPLLHRSMLPGASS